jgi:hypothetical protein
MSTSLCLVTGPGDSDHDLDRSHLYRICPFAMAASGLVGEHFRASHDQFLPFLTLRNCWPLYAEIDQTRTLRLHTQ